MVDAEITRSRGIPLEDRVPVRLWHGKKIALSLVAPQSLGKRLPFCRRASGEDEGHYSSRFGKCARFLMT